jgi:UDP-N-acetyl-D-mannosaminuronate dehydrogenase
MSYVDGFEQIVKEYKKPNIVVAEVGTYDGSTTMHIAPIVKEENGTYIAIDWFKAAICPTTPCATVEPEPEPVINWRVGIV